MAIITIYAFAQTIQWPAGLPIVSGRLTAQQTLTIDRYQTYLTARKALALTLFLGLLLLHTATAKRLRWLVRVVIGLGLASALFGILRESLQSPDSTSGFVLPYLYYGTGYGQFISPNAFSYLMEMSFGLLAGLVVGGGVRRQRLAFYLAVGLIIWAALVLSNSRGGILSFVCQAVFLLGFSLSWLSARRLSDEGGRGQKLFVFVRTSVLVRVLFIAVIVVTLVMGVVWVGGEKLASKVEQSSVSSLEESDGATRKDTWKATWGLIKKNPWTGVGFGAYFLGITQYRTGSGRIRVDQAHNEYLDLAANGGFVAVALSGWFLALVIWRSRSSLRSRDPYRRAASLGAAAGILGVAVHSLVDFGLQVTGIAVVCAALIVIATVDVSGLVRRA